MPIWHQSPKLTPRYFLETPRLFGYPKTVIRQFNYAFKAAFASSQSLVKPSAS